MSEDKLKLSYSLSGYDYAKECRQVARRLRPAYIRYAVVILLICILAIGILLGLASRNGYPLLGRFNWLFIAALIPGWVIFMHRQKVREWNTFANAPIRSGKTIMIVDDEGVVFSNDFYRSTLLWPGIIDVIEGEGGILLLSSAMEFTPIPSEAFASEAEKNAVLADLKARAASKKASV